MYWNDIDQISGKLEEHYPDEEIPENNLLDLKDMVLSLQEFEDHETDVDDSVLQKIIEHWIEIRDKNH